MKKDRKDLSKKHPPERKINQAIAAAIKSKAKDGELTCAQAFDIVVMERTTPGEVGFTMDMLGVGISMCQLGLFGYRPVSRILKPAGKVDPALEEAIRSALVNGRLPCSASWAIAKNFRTAKIRISSACEALKLKISSCQLGAF
jgi:hypothetical protein